uniref:Terpine synthase-like protein MTPSL6 n=1 Tax=Anthoceros punctatus TaxID=3234 RepID=A0A2P1ED39_ANTPU|nr:terpine synthase-like protein MTPSL6 [Anthoceros punctatus]
MDVCRLTASVRCVRTSSSSYRAVASHAPSTSFLRLPVSSTLNHKAQATCVDSLSDSVRCQGEAAVIPAKPAPVVRLVRSDEGGGAGMNASVLTPVYIDFLQSMSFSRSRESCYPELLDAVVAGVKANGGSHLPEPYIKSGAGFGHLVYSFHPVDLQAKIGHFTALGLMADDLATNLTGAARESYLEDMRLFQMKFTNPEGYARLYPGRGNLHQVLENFNVYLKTDQNPFFPTELRLHSLMIKSVFDFMEANLQEQHYERHPIEYTADMSQLPRFLRYKSGVSEVFSHFVILQTSSSGSASQDEHFFYNELYPMVPELIDFIDFGNDVLSFYKEVQEGEDSISIVTHSRIHNLPLLQSLQERMEAVIHSRTRLMALADRTGSDAIKDRIVRFFQGFMSCHIVDKRYRLDEVLRGWYNGGSWA